MKEMIEKKMNFIALVCWGITMGILGIAYVAEIAKGLRSISYVLIVMGIGMAPFVAALIRYQKKKSCVAIRMIMMLGYQLFYAIVLFESPFALTVVYIFPILAVLMLYGDGKLTTWSVGITMGIVCARVFYAAVIQKIQEQKILQSMSFKY